MNHCENCNCKEEKWVQLNEKIEMQSVSTLIKSEKDIIIPDGMRLPAFSEITLALEKGIIPLSGGWIEYCIWQEKIAAVWVDYGSDWFSLYCFHNHIYDGSRSRWVRFVREIKK